MRKIIAASALALTLTAAAMAGTMFAGAAGADVIPGHHGYVVTSPGGAQVHSCPSKSCPVVDSIPTGGWTGGWASGEWLSLDTGGWASTAQLTQA
ncbi:MULTISPECIES: hypothetical protein [Nonomuraea]|uniref:Secreted protein n=1 Tax=Nonomuraea mangrovi TaxID=2316207 RepID=A0ABW4TBE2_9ACTN